MKFFIKCIETLRRHKYWVYSWVLIVSVGVIYVFTDHFNLEQLRQIEYFRLSMHLKEDTETLQMIIYKNYDINHEEILRTGGAIESFLGICKREEDCRLLRRDHAIRACRDIISSNTFNEWRVYHCWTKPNLKFTNRLKCRALTFGNFKHSCKLGYKIAQT